MIDRARMLQSLAELAKYNDDNIDSLELGGTMEDFLRSQLELMRALLGVTQTDPAKAARALMTTLLLIRESRGKGQEWEARMLNLSRACEFLTS